MIRNSLLILCALLLNACAKPTVSFVGVTDARVTKASLSEIALDVELELEVTGTRSLTLRDLRYRVRVGDEILVRGEKPVLELRINEAGLARTWLSFEIVPNLKSLPALWNEPLVLEASARADLGLMERPLSFEREIAVGELIRSGLGL